MHQRSLALLTTSHNTMRIYGVCAVTSRRICQLHYRLGLFDQHAHTTNTEKATSANLDLKVQALVQSTPEAEVHWCCGPMPIASKCVHPQCASILHKHPTQCPDSILYVCPLSVTSLPEQCCYSSLGVQSCIHPFKQNVYHHHAGHPPKSLLQPHGPCGNLAAHPGKWCPFISACHNP